MRTTQLLALYSLTATLVANRADAQTPALTAREVTTLVQSFYDQTTSMEARFQQVQFTRAYDRTENASGRVVFAKPGKLRFDYDAPNGQVFVSDGQNLRIYQPPQSGEREGQLIERPMRDDQLPMAFSFLTGTGRLDRDFRIRLVDATRQSFPNGYVLELRPRHRSPQFDRLLFFVRIAGTGARRAGVIERIMILDSAGNRNRFDLADVQFNRTVAASRFQFSPPRGTRVVRQ